MSVIEHLNPFHHNNGNATMIPSGSMVAMTEDGKKALDRGMLSGTEYTIMLALDGTGSMSVSNIARESGLNPRDVEMQIKGLRRQGYIGVKNFEQEQK